MMSAEIVSPYGFADSKLLEYRLINGELMIRITAWNERILLIKFTDIIDFHHSLAYDFSDALINATNRMSRLQEALNRNYEQVPLKHPYNIYTFFDNDDLPAIEVVAAEYTLKVEADLTSA